MRDRIASIVSVAPFLVACGTAAALSDPGLSQGGAVDGQALSARIRCPRGAHLIHGQTMGVETALWCERPGGVKHGPFVEWYENHQMKTTGEHQDGHRQGTWSFWLQNGQLDSRITYERGTVVSTEAGPPAAPSPAPPPPVGPVAAPAEAGAARPPK